MKLSQLTQFIAAAERGSLRAAARDLNIAQPAISRAIREIEHEVGAPLFERHQKGVLLTAAGEVYLRRALAVRAELRRAQEEIDQIKGQMTGEVSVAMTAVAAFSLLPRTLAAFQQRFPDARVKVTTGFFPAAEAQLHSGQLDFYVGPLRDRSALTKFAVEKLFDHRWVVVGRKGHPLAGCRSLADLGAARWSKVSLTDSAYEADISRPFVERGLPAPRIVVQCSSPTTTLMAVATSDLLTIVPRQLLNTPFARDQFAVFDLDQPLDGAPIHAVRRADLSLTPLAEFFYDMMLRAAVGLAANR